MEGNQPASVRPEELGSQEGQPALLLGGVWGIADPDGVDRRVFAHQQGVGGRAAGVSIAVPLDEALLFQERLGVGDPPELDELHRGSGVLHAGQSAQPALWVTVERSPGWSSPGHRGEVSRSPGWSSPLCGSPWRGPPVGPARSVGHRGEVSRSHLDFRLPGCCLFLLRSVGVGSWCGSNVYYRPLLGGSV